MCAMRKSKAVWVIASLLAILIATPASAAICRKKITSFWGYEYYGQYDCYNGPIGPSIPIVLIGEIVRECDDTQWSWGVTNCTHPDAKTIEYEDCESCEASLRTGPSGDAIRKASTTCRGVTVPE